MTVTAAPHTATGGILVQPSAEVAEYAAEMDRAHSTPAGRAGLIGQAIRFVIVGSLGMALYLATYAAFGLIVNDQVANVTAWVLSTVLGNAAHRRHTFGVTGSEGVNADRAVSMVTALLGLAASSLLLAASAGAGTAMQLALLIAGSAVGGTIRFMALRLWLGRSRAA